MLAVDVTWEPRLRPMGLKQPMADVVAVDENGKTLPADDRKAEVESLVQSDVTGIELELPLALPPRRSKRSPVSREPPGDGAGQDRDLSLRRPADGKNVEKRIAGVTVTLEQVRQNNDPGKCGCGRDSTTPANRWNRIAAGSCKTKPTWKAPTRKPIPFGSQETTQQSHNEIGLAYVFSLKQPPRNLTFVYKTPGVIVTTAFPYEIKDIKLP